MSPSEVKPCAIIVNIFEHLKQKNQSRGWYVDNIPEIAPKMEYSDDNKEDTIVEEESKHKESSRLVYTINKKKKTTNRCLLTEKSNMLKIIFKKNKKINCQLFLYTKANRKPFEIWTEVVFSTNDCHIDLLWWNGYKVAHIFKRCTPSIQAFHSQLRCKVYPT